MNREENKTFYYSYSAKQQEEIKAIRKKYAAPPELEDKMTQLRLLDQSVTQKATARALAAGVIGTLLLGFGMSLVMTDLGRILGALREFSMLFGIGIGLVGIALVCCAYPLYEKTVRKERQRIAPQILRLTDELMQ